MQEALEITLRAIEERAKLYRKTALAIFLTLSVSAVLAVVLRSWVPMGAVILCVPITGAFFVFDGRRTQRWRERVLQLLAVENVKLDMFLKAISAYPAVPRNTLQAMLHSLRQMDSDQVRSARAEQRQERLTIWATGGLTFVLIMFALSLLYGWVFALLGLLSALLLWIVLKKQATNNTH